MWGERYAMSEEPYCVYCGLRPGITRDHVPPKSFFPKPRPSDLITIPACGSCNKDAGKDEELFLATFMFGEAGVSPAGKRLWNEKLHRMYRKNKGLRRRIANSLHDVEIVTPSGLYIGRGLGVRLENERLEKVVSKIVRGLYYHEYQEALPAAAEVICNFVQRPLAMSPIENIVPELHFGSRKWPGIFEYRFNCVAEKPEASIWLIRFYGCHVFWALTDVRSEANPTTDHNLT